MLKKLAWLYVAGFLGVFIITHTPGLTDAQGRNLGLFKIDPIDDFVHLLSGLAGVYVALYANRYLRLYFQAVGVLYMTDAIVGMTTQKGLLDLSIFYQGSAGPDFSVTNWLINLPHIIISGIAIIIGFRRWPEARRV